MRGQRELGTGQGSWVEAGKSRSVLGHFTVRKPHAHEGLYSPSLTHNRGRGPSAPPSLCINTEGDAQDVSHLVKHA